MPQIPCPTDCTPSQLLGLPTPNCNTGFRRTTPSRLFMSNCNIELPTGSQSAVNAAMKALFDSGDLVSTMELVSFVPADPTYNEVQLSDCKAAIPLIETRTIAFEDRNAIDISNVSPYVANLYYDYDRWANIIANQTNIIWQIAYCNGDVKVVSLLSASIRGFVDYIRAQAAGGLSTETKKFSLMFNGDPLGFDIKPTWNWINAGITL